MKQYLAFHPEEQGWVFVGSPESLGMKGMNNTASTEAIESILAGGREGKLEILDDRLSVYSLTAR